MTSDEQYERVRRARRQAIVRIESIMRDAEVAGVRLCWRSQGDAARHASAQVMLADNAAPEQLVRAEAIARDMTAQILRECAARMAACASLADSMVTAFAKVVPETAV